MFDGARRCQRETGSGRDRVTFESEYAGLGVWKMAWTDTVSGSVERRRMA